ncbi:MAG: energy-coupling factor transporter ATPase [Clostridiales Family XIII bacterium]|jgi:energy-coupling factor transport system ATP-binding protein|nr:energy-coupling factor transporter ATPase [Clostridiales Family XIII bacterium]
MSIRVEHLTHIYNKGLAYETKAVDDVGFTVEDGEFIGIIGHTGSGKSTLIQHLNGILKPESGRIFVGDVEITAKNIKMNQIRKRVGLVFQYPEYQLFEATVRSDVAFGPGNLGLPEDEIEDRVREALRLVGLDFSTYADRSPFELSGGQKRRVAIAGVIAMRPEVLILDEPTAGLDPKAHGDILRMVRSVRDRTSGIVILVSHNMSDVAEMADRVFVMDRGRLVRAAAPAEVFAEADFLRSIGLDVPPATRMANTLMGEGFAPDRTILTLGEMADFLAGRLGGRA